MNFSQTGSIISVTEIASRTVAVAIKVSEDFNFIAGQYIWLQLPELKYPDPKGDTRMFSIASSPNKKGELEIIFRNSDSGYKKTLVEMTSGTAVIFSGPYGSLALPQANSVPVMLVAGGVGIAPFLSMIRFAGEMTSGHKITLVYANKSREEGAYLNELSQIAKADPNFRLIESFGPLDLKTLAKFTNRRAIWFVVGPQGFVDAVGNFLIKRQVSLGDIIFEQFYLGAKFKSQFEKQLESVNPDFQAIAHPYLMALDNASSHIIITDTNGIILYANKGAGIMTGYTFAEMRGNTPRLWGGLMPATFYRELWKTIKDDRRVFMGEVKNRRKNQEEYYALMRVSPIIDQDGVLTGFVATEEDITEQKRVAKDLDNAQKATQNVLEDLNTEKSKVEIAKAKDEATLSSIGDGLVVTDRQGKIIRINQAFEKILGWSWSEVKDKKFVTIVPMLNEAGEAIPESERLVNKTLRRKTTTTTTTTTTTALRYRRKDGSVLPVMITISPIVLEGVVTGAVEIFRDITKEKDIDRAKTEFVSLASHQLRTPLSTVNWYSEMLLAGDAGKVTDQQRKYLDEIYRGNQRMVGLVNALLDVSRLEMGTFVNEPEPTDIAKLTAETVAEQQPQVAVKKITLTTTLARDLPLIQADPKLWRMVVQNLLSNAVKYTPVGGQIELALSLADPKHIQLKVADTGCGIPKGEQNKVFTKLFRADNVKEQDTEGTGLGLYIVQSVVTQAGGKVWFESAENRGTVFYVQWPLEAKNPK